MPPKRKPTTTTTTPLTASQLEQEINAAAPKIGAGTASAAPGSASALGISATQAGLPVTFQLPSVAKNKLTNQIPNATTGPKGETITTYAGAVQALYEMDGEQYADAVRALIDNGLLASNTPIPDSKTPVPSQTVVTAWKKMALDAANSQLPLSTLYSAGGSMPSLVAAQKAATSALQSAESNYAAPKTAGVQTTDPNKILDALSAAYAATGEGQPPPQLAQAFVTAFQGAETGAESDELTAEKQGEGAAISGLQAQQQDLQSGDASAANAAGTAPGPVIIAAKPSPDLDSDAMAQAKNQNPGEYYATQSSYLYGLLNNMIQGAPSYQTAPTAPSQAAPGGADLGTPLVSA